jgi:general secretion pathway protein H
LKSIHGFTLIELLVVLVLIGAVYGLASLSLGKRGPQEIKEASRQLAAGLRKARSLAVSRRQDAALMLDVEARSFIVEGDAKRHLLPKDMEISLVTAQSELQSGASGTIRFFPDGGSTGGRITLQQGERRQAVDVDWLTGQVRILPGR